MESETGAADIRESRRVPKPTAFKPSDWGYEGMQTGFRHQGRFRVKAPGSGAIEQLTRELGALAEAHPEAAGTLELVARTLEEQKAEIDALRVKLTHVKGSLSRQLAEVEASNVAEDERQLEGQYWEVRLFEGMAVSDRDFTYGGATALKGFLVAKAQCL